MADHSSAARATSTSPATSHHQVVVIGGGNAGLSVAGRLRRYGVDDIVVIEPRTHHLYQPLFSHVAGGTARAGMATKPQSEVMPKGVGWIRDSVVDIDPESSTVVLTSGDRVTFDHVIVCPGIQKDWDSVPGLAAAMASPHGASHYEFDLAKKASRLLRDLERGTVVFTQPAGPASCAGASQKPMYLACDYWRAKGRLGAIRVIMVVPDPTVFGIPAIDEELDRKIAEYGIELRLESELLEVDAASRTVVIGQHGAAQNEHLAYDVLHVVPTQSAPDWLKSTSLPAAGSSDGFVEVDPELLRHTRYPNVWALGDAAATRNSKSGGALRTQALVLAKNLVAVLGGEEPTEKYDGYSVAPFTVSRSTVVFAEFDDAYRQQPTIPFWKGLARERRLTWVFDRHILPWVYWNLILKGRA
ncbi:sulfide:quinone oxidoreductase [Glaciihabitans tibetensis]|uniref:Sulfide:quinone oxidoreductase n=1 Tax=Glaciihabitans tibetensis TaxID=1266600 RepID=A0A2T0VH11_9MICO|nr:FAD-dependent oxidoreductase [Glaciihabitans tibetensis]PRY69363.1 sulfide:quinone oxidoreductase [Glaciihabitans tibetensis]